jgi:hypothetical protein
MMPEPERRVWLMWGLCVISTAASLIRGEDEWTRFWFGLANFWIALLWLGKYLRRTL